MFATRDQAESALDYTCGAIPQEVHEPSVGFDYAEVDRRVFNVKDECGHIREVDAAELVKGYSAHLIKIVRWINSGDGDTARAIRALAVEFHLTGKTQAQIGRGNGFTRAAISKSANAFRDDFALDKFLVRAPHMRTTETREKFSQQCKKRHQKRKSKRHQTYVDSLKP